MSAHWRLLAGWATGRSAGLADHRLLHGDLGLQRFPGESGRASLVDDVTAAGLLGRGGAAFPLGRKLAAVASAAGSTVVVGNGCEAEPASQKDRVLCTTAPHLVVDGLLAAAYAVGADTAYLCAHRGSPALAALERALAERSDAGHVQLRGVPVRFVASQESALVSLLGGGQARPTSTPPRVFERGVAGRPTVVSNVETLAHLALVARHGAAWYRSVGTERSPGTALVTVAGAVGAPGVVEVAYGTSLSDVLALCGGPADPPQALLVGGWSGAWLAWPEAAGLAFDHAALRAAGGTVGVASIEGLPADRCGLARSAQLLRYLADGSARQCGPCMFGLPAVASDLVALAAGRADAGLASRLQRRLGQVTGRGACAHPDGAVRMAESALRVFASDVTAHLHGQGCLAVRSTTAPLPQALVR